MALSRKAKLFRSTLGSHRGGRGQVMKVLRAIRKGRGFKFFWKEPESHANVENGRVDMVGPGDGRVG